MIFSNKIKLILLIFIIQIPYLSIAFPYRFRRIIFPENNKVIKTIDVISDIHDPIHELVKKPSRKSTELQPKEKSIFTTAERTLLIALRKLAAQNKQIDLLWEITRTFSATEPSSAIFEISPTQDLSKIDWIMYGQALAKEFAPEQHKSIILKNADTYRHNNPGEINLNVLLANYPNVTSHAPLSTTVVFIEDLLNPAVSKAEIDLTAVKTHAFKSYYARLEKYWKVFKFMYVQSLYNYFNQFLKANPTMTFDVFRQQEKTIPDKINSALIRLADAEFAIKSFASDSNHTIIYAGGNHCNNVVDLLTDQTRYEKNFGGKLTIDLGTDQDRYNDKKNNSYLSPVLIPKTWVYLSEDPDKSYKRYKSYGNKPFKNLADKTLWDQFITLRNTVLDLPLAKATPVEDKNILAQLITFYKKASKTFIDFINVRDGARKTLLFYAVEKNLPTITEFLLKHTARVNTQDTAGNTPLHYAQSKEIINLLRKYGAQENIQNIATPTTGNTPLLIASKKGDLNTVQKLLKAGTPVNQTNSKRETALILATIGNHDLIIKNLLEANADVNTVDKTRKTALHYAAINGNKNIIDMLIFLYAKADANKEDSQGFTPLLYAAQHNHADAIKALMHFTNTEKTLQKAHKCCPEAAQHIEDALKQP